jgi:hypothetical protein
MCQGVKLNKFERSWDFEVKPVARGWLLFHFQHVQNGQNGQNGKDLPIDTKRHAATDLELGDAVQVRAIIDCLGSVYRKQWAWSSSIVYDVWNDVLSMGMSWLCVFGWMNLCGSLNHYSPPFMVLRSLCGDLCRLKMWGLAEFLNWYVVNESGLFCTLVVIFLQNLPCREDVGYFCSLLFRLYLVVSFLQFDSHWYRLFCRRDQRL